MTDHAHPAPRTGFAHLGLAPLTPHLGAQVEGLDLRQPLAPGALADVQAALVEWKVLFFREQHLDHAQHVAFARQMGAPTIGHVVFGHDAEFPEVYSVAKHRAANSIRGARMRRPWTDWHTDITAAVNPPMASILRGVTIPPYGGDTYWTDLAAAYRRLSAPLGAFLETLDGLHRFEAPPAKLAGADYDKQVSSRWMESLHPLVAVHPVSGEKLLYVSPGFVTEIDGLAPRESQALLELLWEHVVRAEFTVRHKWRAGDVAMWDNRSTAHLAPTDVFETDFDRQLYRVTLVGEPLTGVDGRRSRAISGEPILSARDELARREA